jgi:glycosyltransferase involved in cell wall biosynthesis
MSLPIVSVIIPTYNYAHYIGEAIESVLEQSYKKIEIIVVDDGSTDNTKEVIAKYPKVKYFFQTNKGISSANNRGVRLSKGDYYLILDADDKLHPQYIERCMKEMLDKRVGFVWTATKDFGLSNKTHYPRFFRHRFDAYRGFGGQTVSALIRKTVFNEVGGYDTTLLTTEDFDMAIRILFKGWKCKPIFEPLHYHRIHKRQLSRKMRKLWKEKHARLLEDKYPLMQPYIDLCKFLQNPKIAIRKLAKKLKRKVCP